MVTNANYNEELRKQLYKAVQEKNINEIDRLLGLLANSPETAEAVLDSQGWAQAIAQERELERAKSRRRKNRVVSLSIFIILIAIGLAALILIWLKPAWLPFFPRSTETPIVVTQVVTQVVTATPNPGPTPTPQTIIVEVCPTELVPTETPTQEVILSKAKIYPTYLIYPELPTLAEKVWLVDDGQAVLEPAYVGEGGVWLAAESPDPESKKEPYLYTQQGGVKVTFALDAPVPEDGIYQILVLDTAKNSNLGLTFTVLLDDQALQPYRGSTTVFYNPDAKVDQWLSLGFYQVSAGQNLIVTAQVPPLGEQQAFAVDRLAILKIPREMEGMLEGLPSQQALFSLVDDWKVSSQILVGGSNFRPYSKFLGGSKAALAWNMAYQISQETPQSEVQVIWPAGRLGAGEYKLLVWVPELNATARVTYQLLVNGKALPIENVGELVQNDFGGEWVDMGLWRLDQDGQVDVVLTVAKGESGLVGVDAVALVSTEAQP